MTGLDIKTARTKSDWTQSEAAERLGVTQAYLSMLERGSRPISDELASKALRVLRLPPTSRALGRHLDVKTSEFFFKRALGELGYRGFLYLNGRAAVNPAELLLLALDSKDLDARVTEALPWLPLEFPEMDWAWLSAQSRLRDRQNRLAYVVSLASEVAGVRGELKLANTLRERVADLERSRLANEDTLAKSSLSQAERRWLRTHRTALAAHWNLLTDLKMGDLAHVF